MVERLISTAGAAVSKRMLAKEGGLDPDTTLAPINSASDTIFKGKTIRGLTPAQVAGMMSSRSSILSVAIMMLIIIGSSSVISSMGLEKENKTLETLLTMPVSRRGIILSKVIGSAIVGVLMGAIYMVGFAGFMGSMGGGGLAAGAGGIGLALSVGDYVLVGLSVFFALLAALCLSIVIGAFANNMRSAQTLTFPISGLAIFVMLLTTFQDFGTLPPALKAAVFMIPFSHPMMAMNELMTDGFALVLAGIAYSIAFTAAMVAIAAWIFNSDKLLSGRIVFRRRPA
jgi:ABC-2 type transport system permease protein